MFVAAIPLLRASSSREALVFYRDRLGFSLRSTYCPVADAEDPAYHVLTRDGAVIHVSSFPGDGTPGATVVTIVVANIAALYAELVRSGVDVGEGILVQDWGDREIHVRDPSGNRLRFQSG